MQKQFVYKQLFCTFIQKPSMKRLLIISNLLLPLLLTAQPVKDQLQKALQRLQNDSQLQHGIVSFSVFNTQTNEPVFEQWPQLGLAPASIQKIFTSIAAFDILGKEYRFKTQLGYEGTIKDSILQGNFIIKGSGDPTLGSFRFSKGSELEQIKQLTTPFLKLPIRKLSGKISIYSQHFSAQSIPDGWIWQDIGNYYGAGSNSINWNENQFSLPLNAGNNTGDAVNPASTSSFFTGNYFINELKAGSKGSGDNAYIYLAPHSGLLPLIKGSIPAGAKNFEIAGANSNPEQFFLAAFKEVLRNNNFLWPETGRHAAPAAINQIKSDSLQKFNVIYTHHSPPLDSINYFFLRKSINLYGEALLKVLALEKNGYADTETGVVLLKEFWASKGIHKNALNISDGSGLSPQNRVTTRALVQALQYASKQKWFASFYNALPEYNSMKIKSGSINGCRSFAGYHTSKSGTRYTVAIIVNNYNGSSSSLIKKIYQVLDVLK
ncbi:MAG: hypothetical protein RLZZ316_1935 [Bacteroidota bacterium]